MPRLRGGNPEPLQTIYAGALNGVVIDPSVDIEDAQREADACPTCRDCGFLRRDLPITDPDFGRALPCPTCGPARHAERVARLTERLWGDGQWTHYRAMTFDTFPWSPQTSRHRATLEAWLDDDPKWLLLHGPYGRGKTGLSVALIRRLVERGQQGLLVTVPQLLDRIKATYGASDDSEADVVDTLITVPVLLMDDMGKEKPSDWVAEKLYTILNSRMLAERRTIITMNDEPEVGLGRVGEAVMWRVIAMAKGYMLHVDGPNLRAR